MIECCDFYGAVGWFIKYLKRKLLRKSVSRQYIPPECVVKGLNIVATV